MYFDLKQRQPCSLSQSPSTGFTLIEIMVVVFVIGILALSIGLIANRDGVDQQMEQQLAELSNQLLDAQQRARLEYNNYGLWIHERGWQVMQLTPRVEFLTWGITNTVQGVNGNGIKSPTRFGATAIDAPTDQATIGAPRWRAVDKAQAQLNSSFDMSVYIGKIDGFEETQALELEASGSELPRIPQIMIASDGEVTPFELRLSSVKAQREHGIRVDEFGDISEVDELED